MEWGWRYYLIVPAGLLSAANHAAARLTGNAADEKTLSVSLSPDGTGAPTHYGCSLAAYDGLMAAMRAALPQLTGLLFYRCTADTDPPTLDGTNSTGPSAGMVGKPFGWPDALADAGLKAIAPPKP